MSLEFGILEVLVLFRVSVYSKLHTGPENNKLSGKARRRQEGRQKGNEGFKTPSVLFARNCVRQGLLRSSAHLQGGPHSSIPPVSPLTLASPWLPSPIQVATSSLSMVLLFSGKQVWVGFFVVCLGFFLVKLIL